MTSIQHQVGIRGFVQEIFDALTQPDGLERWWSTRAHGTSAVGKPLQLEFGDEITLVFMIIEMEPNQHVLLECPTGPGPWKGSRLKFGLEAAEDQVFVTLKHWNDEASEKDFLYFNTKWPIYLLSLRDFIESGKGRPSPNDIPIYFGDNVRSNTN